MTGKPLSFIKSVVD
ncbi:hypothetical protein YPPY98_3998, partial [Yersinia pestis PY-98]